MRLQGWFYVAPSDTAESALDRVNRLQGPLTEQVEAGTLAGFWVVAITDPDDFDEQDIDSELVTSVTGGRLPAVYLQLTYDLDRCPPGRAAVEVLLGDLGFVHALTDPPAPVAG